MIDNDIIARAKETDMKAFLEKIEGFHFKKSGNNWRCEEHESLVINSDNRRWFWNSQGVGGANAIDYLVKIRKMPFADAVLNITDGLNYTTYTPQITNTVKSKPQTFERFILPETAHRADGRREYKHIIAYLTQKRCIDKDIINQLIRDGKLYEGVSYSGMQLVGYDSNGEAYYRFRDESSNKNCESVELTAIKQAKENETKYIVKAISKSKLENEVMKTNPKIFKNYVLVAVGYDNSKAKFACYRSVSDNMRYRADIDGSKKEFPFELKGSKSKDGVYVFESFIDAISHAQLYNIKYNDQNAWKIHNRISLSGTTDVALDSYLSRNPNIRQICFCLDNDEAGKKAARTMGEKYKKLGYIVHYRYPNCKDYNDELKSTVKANEQIEEIEQG